MHSYKHRHTHAISKHSKCSSLHLVTRSALPLTQHSSTNTHKHIRTHFHTYPQTDTNKRTHTPQCNGCQDKNNVANDLEREKQRDSALCAYVSPDGKNLDKWWCAENLSVAWSGREGQSVMCVDALTTCKDDAEQVSELKCELKDIQIVIRFIFFALTFTSVVVTLGWVTGQGMTSCSPVFRYNTSGLIPGRSTNGCWLSETQTLRSGTHMVQIIST